MDATRILQGASSKLCDKNETHVILSIDKVTKAIKIFGDEKSVDLMVDDGPLHYGFSYHFQGTFLSSN